ncbi:MAG TPA: hypothetical protein VMS17_21560 [Gemmataceae bacterium]|nr:hypothetical protein [Gemmataceae bacterium]
MKNTMWRWGAVLLSCAILLGASAVQAQVRLPNGTPSNSRGGTPTFFNPAFNVTPGIQQYSNLYNAAILGRTINQIPPWVYGYNPYPSPIMNSAPYSPYMGSLYPAALTGYGAMAGGYPYSPTLTTSGTGYDASSLTTTPAGGYGGYGGYYPPYYDPSYGFLSGTADVINAYGQFEMANQKARLTQTQADESRIDYRRRLIDEARYEQGLLPTTEQLRQQELARNLEWARHQPPITDVVSARTLNDLLNHLTSDPTVGKGQNVPIPDDVLDRINVTSPMKVGASLGLLKAFKHDGKLHWPQGLLASDFDGARNQLTERLGSALSALTSSNRPNEGTITDLHGDLNQLRAQLGKSEMSPTDYIAASSYLTQLDSTIRALEDENAVANFNNNFSAKNVAELVDYMKTKGLQFAPAAPGDDGAYWTLQQALVTFDYSASPQASAAPAPTTPSTTPSTSPRVP